MFNKLKIVSIYILGALFVVGAVVIAGNIDNNNPPGSTFVTLGDIYNKLNNIATSSKSFSPLEAPTSTMLTLEDIWNQIPIISADTVISSTTILGVEGSYDITNLTPEHVLLNTNYGTSSVGSLVVPSCPAPLTWSADQYLTAYDCSWLTGLTDPSSPPLTSSDICNASFGCSWNVGTSQCDGGMQTGRIWVTLFAGREACAHSTEDGQLAGTWRLPTYSELFAASPPGDFPTGDFSGSGSWWSDTEYLWSNTDAWFVYAHYGSTGHSSKNSEASGNVARCVR